MRSLLRRLLRREPARPVRLVLYTRPACCLCDEMKAEMARARTRVPWVVEEVDVESDPELERLHGRSVPVLCIGGRPAFKGRLTAEAFAAKLARRCAEEKA